VTNKQRYRRNVLIGGGISRRILYDCTGNAAGRLGFRSGGSEFGGDTMENAIASHVAEEHFVIRVDGRIKSHHHRFIDALREGLWLRDQLPHHTVKVCVQSDQHH
jgi:hypothetical protein